MKKYLVYSGWIPSLNDMNFHHIKAHKVAQLFKVRSEDCIFITEETLLCDRTGIPYGLREEDFIKLYPSFNYDLAEVIREQRNCNPN